MRTVSLATRETVIAGLVLLALALALGVRQWLERRRREPAATDLDARYFAGRDRRRALSAALMGLAAGLMLASVRIDPRRSRADARLWLLLWVGVLGLTFVLVLLAGLDWVANRGDAIRQRRQLDAEQRALLAEMARLRPPPPPARHHADGRNGTTP